MIPENQKDFLVNHIVDKLVEFLVEDYAIGIPEALKAVYESDVFVHLQDTEYGLYSQSPSYIYELLKKEIKH